MRPHPAAAPAWPKSMSRPGQRENGSNKRGVLGRGNQRERTSDHFQDNIQAVVNRGY